MSLRCEGLKDQRLQCHDVNAEMAGATFPIHPITRRHNNTKQTAVTDHSEVHARSLALATIDTLSKSILCTGKPIALMLLPTPADTTT
jgi:hypothetical protein